MQENYDEYTDALQFLKDNYTNEEILNNEKILNMVQTNHEYNFNMDMRNTIEYLKDKYTKLYDYVDIFKNDKNNVNYERLYDIIYDNITKKYNFDLVYDEPEKIMEILEKH